MSGEEPSYSTPNTRQEEQISRTVGEELQSIIESGRQIVRATASRLTPGTGDINPSSVRPLAYTDPPIADIQEEFGTTRQYESRQ